MSISSSSATTQALSKVLQVPRQDYRTCPAFLHDIGFKPNLAKIDEVEKYIVRIWRALALGSLATIILTTPTLEPSFQQSLSAFLDSNSLKDRAKLLETFKNALVLSEDLDAFSTYIRVALFIFNEVATPNHCCGQHNSGDICICSVAASALQMGGLANTVEKSKSLKIEGCLESLCLEGNELITRGNNITGKSSSFDPRLRSLANEIYNLTETYLSMRSEHPYLQFVELMAWIGGSRTIAWSNFYLLGGQKTKTATDETDYFLSFSCLPFTQINEYIKKVEREGKVITLDSLEELKLEADKLASAKNYTKAIELYSIVGEPAPNVNAKVNCAALRLRIAKDTDNHQFQLVIMDCTFALELEPNHVKALFRRGLAFCKLKMWNEGIVDFERAIELDPRSPAVKELAIARRQVMRRLGP